MANQLNPAHSHGKESSKESSKEICTGKTASKYELDWTEKEEMKISEIRDAYYDASGKASELIRQLALAGIAAVWIFRVGGCDAGGIQYSSILIWPVAFFIGALGCDLLQYVYYSLVWGIMNTIQWRRHKDNDREVDVSGKWNWIGLALFWLKVALALAGYVFLLVYIFGQL